MIKCENPYVDICNRAKNLILLSFGKSYVQVHQVKCEETGKWSAPLKRCITAGRCSKPEAKGIIFLCNENFPGDTCNSRCETATNDVVDPVSVAFHNVMFSLLLDFA